MVIPHASLCSSAVWPKLRSGFCSLFYKKGFRYKVFVPFFLKGMWGQKIFKCGCGSTIQDKTGNIVIHNKSQKHLDFLKIGLPCKRRRKHNNIIVDTEKLNSVQLDKNIILENSI